MPKSMDEILPSIWAVCVSSHLLKLLAASRYCDRPPHPPYWGQNNLFQNSTPPPLCHHISIRNLLAKPPLPPQVMMFFMNSPLQALKVKVCVTLFEGSMLLISEAFDHLR